MTGVGKMQISADRSMVFKQQFGLFAFNDEIGQCGGQDVHGLSRPCGPSPTSAPYTTLLCNAVGARISVNRSSASSDDVLENEQIGICYRNLRKISRTLGAWSTIYRGFLVNASTALTVKETSKVDCVMDRDIYALFHASIISSWLSWYWRKFMRFSLFKQFKLLIPLVVLAMACELSQGQLILNNTTTSAAIADGSVRTFNVASATNINAPSFQDNTKNTFLYVDRELMNVENVQGTLVTVTRGIGGTMAVGHTTASLVFVIPGYLGTFWFGLPTPAGNCTRSAVIALPVISPTQGVISDCQAGRWVNGTATQTTTSAFYRLESPTIGAVSNAAAIGTNSTVVAAELYCTEIRLPSDKLLTGLAPHIATTGGTDKWIVALYDSGGNLLANSALAGATVGTANTWQQTAFTTPYYAVGEDQYFGCVMSNGTTATLDTVTTGKDDNILTFKSASAGTFGTLPSFTAPTSFASVSGAYLYAY